MNINIKVIFTSLFFFIVLGLFFAYSVTSKRMQSLITGIQSINNFFNSAPIELIIILGLLIFILTFLFILTFFD